MAVADDDGIARAERLLSAGDRLRLRLRERRRADDRELEPEVLEQRRDELARLRGRERERQRQAVQHLGHPVDESRLVEIHARVELVVAGDARRDGLRVLGGTGQLGERTQHRRADEALNLGGAARREAVREKRAVDGRLDRGQRVDDHAVEVEDRGVRPRRQRHARSAG